MSTQAPSRVLFSHLLFSLLGEVFAFVIRR